MAARVFSQLLQHIHQLLGNAHDDARRFGRGHAQRTARMQSQPTNRAGRLCRPASSSDSAASQFKARITIRATAASATRRNFRSPASRFFCCATAFVCNDDEAVRMVLHTCDHMAAGGIHDQLGGGFARYSVDARMARAAFRENALRQRATRAAYLDAYLVSGEAAPCRRRARHSSLTSCAT